MRTAAVLLICCISILMHTTPLEAELLKWRYQGTPVCTAEGHQLMTGWGGTIATDGAGGAIMVWEDARGLSDPYIYAQRLGPDGRVLWEVDGIRISADGPRDPSIASDERGGAIFTWTSEWASGPDNDIYAQRVDSTGARLWTAVGVPVCAASLEQQMSVLASDGTGGAIVAWVDRRTGSGEIFAQRMDSLGVAQWAPDGVLVSTTSVTSNAPNIISDGAGGAILAWQTSSSDIYAQRLDPYGTELWTTNGLVVCAATGSQLGPRAVGDGAEGAIIAWYDERGANAQIYCQRVSAAGVEQWTANGVIVSSTPTVQIPAITTDGKGGAIVAWAGNVGGEQDILAQRVTPSGSLAWSPEVPICTAPDDQNQQLISSDNMGGAVITWGDFRDGPPGDPDVFAQRVDSLGTIMWATDGVAVYADSGSQYDARIVCDEQGNSIIAWWDDRYDLGGGDILARKILPSGRYALPPYPDSCFAEWQDLVCDTTKVLTCPGGDGSSLHVSLKNEAGQPMDSVLVLAGMISNCSFSRGSPQAGVTDQNGELTLPIAAGLDASAGTACCEVDMVVASMQVTIPWKSTGGAQFDRRQWLSPDLNGDCQVGLPDQVIMVADFGFSGICRTDFDCDGFVAASDQAVMALHVTHSCANIVGIEESVDSRNGVLEQNHPNPFGRRTQIIFSAVKPGPVSLRVYDVRGRLVRTLLDSVGEPRGYEITWDGRDDKGKPAPSGIYFYRAKSPGADSIKRMILIR